MTDKYVYRRLVRRNWYRKFRLRRRYVIIFALLVLIVATLITVDLINDNESKPPTSKATATSVSDELNTFQSDYFEFKDKGNWVLNKADSNSQKFVYFKFRGVQPIAQLSIFVNQVPTPVEMAVSRVLPVRIVNQNRLDITNVYGPCVSQYTPQELHKVKVVMIEGANVLCDPDTPLYRVGLSEVGGDWQLEMERKNGEPIKFIIVFRDITLNPGPESILNVANSFRAR